MVYKRILLLPILLLYFGTVFPQTALKVEKVTITVNDLDISLPFYQELLGFKKIGEQEFSGKELNRLLGINNSRLSLHVVQLQLGDEIIELQEFKNEEDVHQIPIDSKSNDLEYGVTHVSTGPQTLPEYIKAASGIKAFYFQDPDRHVLEVIYFPKDKGDAKWQENKDALFLGIDHTAIGIDKTKFSTPFYENRNKNI